MLQHCARQMARAAGGGLPVHSECTDGRQLPVVCEDFNLLYCLHTTAFSQLLMCCTGAGADSLDLHKFTV